MWNSPLFLFIAIAILWGLSIWQSHFKESRSKLMLLEDEVRQLQGVQSAFEVRLFHIQSARDLPPNRHLPGPLALDLPSSSESAWFQSESVYCSIIAAFCGFFVFAVIGVAFLVRLLWFSMRSTSQSMQALKHNMDDGLSALAEQHAKALEDHKADTANALREQADALTNHTRTLSNFEELHNDRYVDLFSESRQYVIDSTRQLEELRADMTSHIEKLTLYAEQVATDLKHAQKEDHAALRLQLESKAEDMRNAWEEALQHERTYWADHFRTRAQRIRTRAQRIPNALTPNAATPPGTPQHPAHRAATPPGIPQRSGSQRPVPRSAPELQELLAVMQRHRRPGDRQGNKARLRFLVRALPRGRGQR
mmetsp:Transcript_76044/g.139066  ORF Transcript_76044/g.139066 Transcript_76044/m.139066 type:complete len:366 (+) Transcript_76044:70-1167(+)